MDHALWVDLLDLPHIGDVRRTEELVGRSLLPPIKPQLKISQKILARQHRVQLVPDDALGEIKAMGLKHSRIVSQIAVSSPEIEAASRLEHPGQIAEPRAQ